MNTSPIRVHIEACDLINDSMLLADEQVECLVAYCHDEGENHGPHEVVLGTSQAALRLITERLMTLGMSSESNSEPRYEIVNDYKPPSIGG